MLDRVLAFYDGDLEKFLALGGGVVEADMAVNFATLDTEASRELAPGQVRAAIDDWLRRALDNQA